ncbi:MAG: hypothetical protein AAB929_05400, partial [Patescibacteria group bacterium]
PVSGRFFVFFEEKINEGAKTNTYEVEKKKKELNKSIVYLLNKFSNDIHHIILCCHSREPACRQAGAGI